MCLLNFVSTGSCNHQRKDRNRSPKNEKKSLKRKDNGKTNTKPRSVKNPKSESVKSRKKRKKKKKVKKSEKKVKKVKRSKKSKKSKKEEKKKILKPELFGLR